MKRKLIYSPNIEYDMHDWERESIEKVYAGTDCILAITTDGRVLQKTKKPELAVRTQYWTRIKQISLSGCAPCHAIGLVSDGTCLISKRYLRQYCDDNSSALRFDAINDKVKSWKDIVQVEVSDSYFALDRFGNVYVSPISRDDERQYAEVRSWKNVSRIVTGPQCSVFGVTTDGRILCAGYNLTRGPHGDARVTLSLFKDVYDVCATGSECEAIFIALKDGTVLDLRGELQPVKALPESMANGRRVFQSHFYYEVLVMNEHHRLVRLLEYGFDRKPDAFDDNPEVDSFAIGDCDYGRPFFLAVTK